MRILNIIKRYNSLKLKILIFKIYKNKTHRYKKNVNINKIYIKLFEVIEIYIQKILLNLNNKLIN
jgi:hypothetical protein